MASKKNPDEIAHLQVAAGGTVIWRGHAYGDRATLQVRRGDLDEVEGRYAEVDPAKVPDAGSVPA